jgi:hypothetical protein
MSTAAQIVANQENATHSTGPITEEGKAASSQNHFKHGFCAHFRVLEYESTEAYSDLITALQGEHQPATPTENILVDRMAQHHWLSQRAHSCNLPSSPKATSPRKNKSSSPSTSAINPTTTEPSPNA